MLLIGQLMWIVTPVKEEKSNTYMYYKREKDKLTSGGHYHRIILFCFWSETNIYQENRLFCVIQSSTSNTVFFDRFINAIYNGAFRSGYLIDIVNPDPIEDYINGIRINNINWRTNAKNNIVSSIEK